ncbi:MAG: alpha/beta fold hydrolase [Paracoccaceae bacterium]|nr:alpha/beta fold hydrolase [Paracoccaceae bacterium]
MTARLTHLGGDGAPLVLIHGYGANRLSFLPLLAVFPVPAAFHAVDLPGHGAAGAVAGDATPAGLAEDVAAVLDGFPAPMPVLGHSLGGAVALELAARHPGLISRLVLIAPAGWGRTLDAGFLRGLPEVEGAEVAQNLLERLVVKPRHIPKDFGRQVYSDLTSERRGDLGTIAEAALAAPAPAVPAIPVTLIWGEADGINPRDPDRSYPGNVTEHVFPGVGHLPHMEKPGDTARIVAAALG